ncbi:MAG: DNA polymerase IV [Bacteroidetes bacterium]|jgi:DNA polymerase-4|nr:DNA polymerase IV [Bacteroidota bacterium]
MQAPKRYIAHFDLDSFFVSVEMLQDPSLLGKAVVVGGSRDRGVVTTCSYEARKFGVRSAMPMRRAMELCPHAIVVKSSYGLYSKYSAWVTNIIAANAPLYEKASIDEFYIDLTGMDTFFNPLEWTIRLRQTIMDETGLPISFGLASNKLVAKIATDEAKPNGYLFVTPGKEKEFLAPLPVEKLGGVGKKSHQTLLGLGIHTIGDILHFDPAVLEKVLGKWGTQLIRQANGKSDSVVSPHRESKSISAENTFEENTSDMDILLAQLVGQAERVAYELRQEKKYATCVAIKFRNANFETSTRQITVPATIADTDIIKAATDLFTKLYVPGTKVRLLGVRLSGLTNVGAQTNLFDNKTEQHALYEAIDAVKNKYGKSLLRKARTIKK